MSKKLKFNGLHLSKNCISSQKALFKDLSNITFNYLCKNSPNSLCLFWNHKSFFTTQLVYIILAQTLRTFDKNIPSNCNFSDFLLLKLKTHQISHVIFQTKSEFFFKLWITVQFHEITFLYFFSWNYIWFWQKKPIKMQNLRLSTAQVKFHQVFTLIASLKYIKF